MSHHVTYTMYIAYCTSVSAHQHGLFGRSGAALCPHGFHTSCTQNPSPSKFWRELNPLLNSLFSKVASINPPAPATFPQFDTLFDWFAFLLLSKLAEKSLGRLQSSLLASLLTKLRHSLPLVVDCPTRWSLWYWYLDFCVDHLVGGSGPI